MESNLFWVPSNNCVTRGYFSPSGLGARCRSFAHRETVGEQHALKVSCLTLLAFRKLPLKKNCTHILILARKVRGADRLCFGAVETTSQGKHAEIFRMAFKK